jgi:hypothetical protein
MQIRWSPKPLKIYSEFANASRWIIPKQPPDSLVAEAAEDLQRICERIEMDNPEAATRVARTIYEGCDRLKQFPRVGRTSCGMPGWRECVGRQI